MLLRLPKNKLSIAAEPWDMICGSEFIQNELPTTYDGAWAVYPYLGPFKGSGGDLAGGSVHFDASAYRSISTGPLSGVRL